jgi:RNA polymerase sigma-70 factor (ECF subfamily)
VTDQQAQTFEAERPHLRAVAYRMLGSVTEADDVVQEAWLRYRRADTSKVENLRGWLTTVVARLCLDALRTRRSRKEDLLGFRLPEPLVSGVGGPDPEQQALLADAVGLAMLVVLEQLTPPERLAFVLHDVFAVPFDEIGPIVDRSPEAARQLASRARRRVRGAAPKADVDVAVQRRVLEAFLAASRAGDFRALVATLDPEAVVRADFGRPADSGSAVAGVTESRGAETVAQQALLFRRFAPGARHAIVNGTPGLVVFAGNRPYAVLAFTVRDHRILEIDILADPERLALIDFAVLDA